MSLPRPRVSYFLDSFRKAIVDVGDRRLEVVGRAPEAVSTPSVGDGAEDVPELPQAIPPARRFEPDPVPRPRKGRFLRAAVARLLGRKP